MAGLLCTATNALIERNSISTKLHHCANLHSAHTGICAWKHEATGAIDCLASGGVVCIRRPQSPRHGCSISCCLGHVRNRQTRAALTHRFRLFHPIGCPVSCERCLNAAGVHRNYALPDAMRFNRHTHTPVRLLGLVVGPMMMMLLFRCTSPQHNMPDQFESGQKR